MDLEEHNPSKSILGTNSSWTAVDLYSSGHTVRVEKWDWIDDRTAAADYMFNPRDERKCGPDLSNCSSGRFRIVYDAETGNVTSTDRQQ